MIDNRTNDKNSDRTVNDGIHEITLDVTSSIKSIVDLWALARITKDIKGDPIWDILYQLGCNPEPFDNLGYRFNYSGFEGLYFPRRRENGIVRFALPKLASTNHDTNDKLIERVNMANSMLAECKFTIIRDEVWLIYERLFVCNDNYLPIVEHILEKLKNGAEFFHSLS